MEAISKRNQIFKNQLQTLGDFGYPLNTICIWKDQEKLLPILLKETGIPFIPAAPMIFLDDLTIENLMENILTENDQRAGTSHIIPSQLINDCCYLFPQVPYIVSSISLIDFKEYEQIEDKDKCLNTTEIIILATLYPEILSESTLVSGDYLKNKMIRPAIELNEGVAELRGRIVKDLIDSNARIAIAKKRLAL